MMWVMQVDGGQPTKYTVGFYAPPTKFGAVHYGYWEWKPIMFIDDFREAVKMVQRLNGGNYARHTEETASKVFDPRDAL